MKYTIVAFYKFVALPEFCELREPLRQFCVERGIKGSILLAHEGINGTVTGSAEAIAELLQYWSADARLADLDVKESFADFCSFKRLKVLLKKEIVASKVPELADPTKQVGQYVAPQDWNAVISDPEVVVIDTRNHFECEVGTFQNAIDPQTRSFGEFPKYVAENLDPKKHKKIAMFCTGGIRCEKASSYMLSQGFENVMHLKGGILKYLEVVPPEESLWKGECFVFDHRVAVGHGVEVGSYSMCHSCGSPVTEAEKQSPYYEAGVSCPACHGKRSADQLRRARERQLQYQQRRENI